jgi:alkylation response protein AidB-like acyl-CoA dehydrogenase
LNGASPYRIERANGAARLTGVCTFVLDAPAADHLLLPADDSGTPVLVAVERTHPGISITETPLVDATRSFGDVIADAAETDPSFVWSVRDPIAMTRLADRAAAAIACDSLGISQAMLDATVKYATVREQFGRPIGSFQAVKHACADMLVSIAIGRQLVGAAVWAVAAGGDTVAEVARAKSFMSATAVEIAGKAMQLHGGIGYTWESDVHVYLKRATLNRGLFGSPRWHRERLVPRLLRYM